MFRPLVSILRRLDPALYAVWAAVQTIASARSFYGYMLKQTGGEWSAPLDDVFIHFDYARSTALGHPFEWTVGNGYSSGNTSLSYPFVLAAGWLAGFRQSNLVVWAGIVAAISTFALLLGVRRIFVEDERDDAGRLVSYLLPPIFLGVGALSWSLWSGMEVAYFLATWTISFVAWWKLERTTDPRRLRKQASIFGATGVLLVLTRPEGAMSVAIFGLAAALRHRHAGLRAVTGLLVRAGAPGVAALAAQSIANKLFTGEWSANGAIVKLAVNNPYMTADDKLADYTFNLRYAAARNLDYHFASPEGEHLARWIDPAPGGGVGRLFAHLAHDAWWAGVLPLLLAGLPLAFARTRRIGVILWAQVVAWIVVVAFNGQVRWQNERYVMPAVAWLLVLATLGVAVALRRHRRPHGRGGPLRPSWPVTLLFGAIVVSTIGVLAHDPGAFKSFRFLALGLAGGGVLGLVLSFHSTRAALVALALLFAYDHQIPKMRDQRWFFGRASRNIRDQHTTLGRALRELEPKRVLVGDAGAILYESELPGLDLIGLGGYHDLPFARAGVHGLPASIELIERMPKSDRPDVLAIFPTWWGVLPTWFSSGQLLRFPVEGNVICGGYEQNVYRADWHLLGTGEPMRLAPPEGAQIRMEIDVADLVSEKENGYAFDRPANGWTDMRILPDPSDPTRDMFDAGRRIAVGRGEHFELRDVDANAATYLVVRSAPESATNVRVRVDGEDAGAISFERTGGWVERMISLPKERVGPGARVELRNEGPGDFVDYHAYVLQ